MGEVRVRRAGMQDALVVAALRLQAAIALGAGPEPGFLDRFVQTWDPEGYPTWIAEQDATHAGILITQVVDELPWPGLATHLAPDVPRGVAPGRALVVVTLHAPPGSGVGTLLTAAMTGWAQDHGLVMTGTPASTPPATH